MELSRHTTADVYIKKYAKRKDDKLVKAANDLGDKIEEYTKKEASENFGVNMVYVEDELKPSVVQIVEDKEVTKEKMVAGIGFEPMTFGL